MRRTSRIGRGAIDANGNTLSDPSGKQYSWDFENRLTQVVNPGVGTTTFKYDPFGRRIQKSGPLGTTNYVYDGLDLIEEADTSGNVLARYTEGLGVDHALSMLRAGTMVYYQQDGIASVTSLSNSSSALANTYSYDSFGRMTGSTGTLTNPFQYTAREFDAETGIYEYRMRYYDSSVGRFLSEDPMRFGLGDTNFYDYVRNRPAVYSDPLGLFPTKWHHDSTLQLAKQIFGPKCSQQASAVADANASVDYPWWGLANPFGSAWRYGGPHFPIGNYADVLVSNAIATCNLNSLGRALHTLQDGYSHPSGPLGPALHFFTGTLFDYTGGVNGLAALGATSTALQNFKDKCLACCTGGSDTSTVAQ